jgi:hypothetical protein
VAIIRATAMIATGVISWTARWPRSTRTLVLLFGMVSSPLSPAVGLLPLVTDLAAGRERPGTPRHDHRRRRGLSALFVNDVVCPSWRRS